MSYFSGMPPRKQISDFVVFALSRQGRTIPEIEGPGKNIPGMPEQLSHRSEPVWHRRKDIIEYVAKEMRMHPSMWGPRRTSQDFQNAVDQELAKLKKAGTAIAYHQSGNTALFRIDPTKRAAKPMPSTEPPRAPIQDDSRRYDMKRAFLSIIEHGSKANTYKFALGRALLEYCKDTRKGDGVYAVPYSYFAKKFLEYYWYQECRYKIKQDFMVNSQPKVITAIQRVFGPSTINDFGQIEESKKAEAERLILKGVFGHARSDTSMVIPKFQKIPVGNVSVENRIFYEYSDDEKMLYIKPEAFSYLKRNNRLLFKALLAEWAKFLERINGSLPKLVAKIEQNETVRGQLAKFRQAYGRYTDSCFYCNGMLRSRSTHVDHFLPWSYIFEDEAWNMVLACQECNCKKSNSLPQDEFLEMLIRRNKAYRDRIGILSRSISQIDTRIGWESEITNHYNNCGAYGFNVIRMP